MKMWTTGSQGLKKSVSGGHTGPSALLGMWPHGAPHKCGKARRVFVKFFRGRPQGKLFIFSIFRGVQHGRGTRAVGVLMVREGRD